MKSLGAMITQLHAMEDTRDLTAWENDFVKSAWRDSQQGKITVTISAKRVEIIDRLYRQHFGDAI